MPNETSEVASVFRAEDYDSRPTYIAVLRDGRCYRFCRVYREIATGLDAGYVPVDAWHPMPPVPGTAAATPTEEGRP